MAAFRIKNADSAQAQQHPFHIVDPSPLPLFLAAAITLFLCHTAFLLHPDYPIHEQGIALSDLVGR